jgi:spore germination cell wall hydrolase CwlJ-like protein
LFRFAVVSPLVPKCVSGMRLRQVSTFRGDVGRLRVHARRYRAHPWMRWALATAAPWALATGMLVSFTASAGQPTDIAISLQSRILGDPSSELEQGPSLLTAASAFNLPALSLSETLVSGRRRAADAAADGAVFETARLSLEEPARLVPMNERRPRGDLKPNIAHFPEVDRSKKADPLLALRPSLTWRTSPMGREDYDRLLFDSHHGGLSARFEPDLGEFQSAPQGLDPHDAEPFQTEPGTADASPPTASDATPAMQVQLPASAPSSRRAERHLESIDGSTPATPRRLALSSTTPQPAGLAPVEVAAAPVSGQGSGQGSTQGATAHPRQPEAAMQSASPAPAPRGRPVTIARKSPSTVPAEPGERPSYVSLIPAEKLEREAKCLAEAVYFEARSEPEEGQAAVAQVVLNRMKSGIYPDNVCGVVYQNRHRYLSCQFTFACEGRSLAIREPEAWTVAVRISRDVLEGRTYLADVGSSTHYHANYVRPWWARRLTRMDTIGRHVFYRLKPGQT